MVNVCVCKEGMYMCYMPGFAVVCGSEVDVSVLLCSVLVNSIGLCESVCVCAQPSQVVSI